MNLITLSTVPLGEPTWQDGNNPADSRSVGENLTELFQWLGSLSATTWLLVGLAVGLGVFYWWCLGPTFPAAYDSEVWDRDDFD